MRTVSTASGADNGWSCFEFRINYDMIVLASLSLSVGVNFVFVSGID